MVNQLLKVFFGEGLLEVTFSGEKTQTLRWYRPEAHSLKKGQRFLGVFAEGLTILCEATEDTIIKLFLDLTDSDVLGSGYSSAAKAFKDLRTVYYKGKGMKKTDTAAIISYRICRIDGVPVVSPNIQ